EHPDGSGNHPGCSRVVHSGHKENAMRKNVITMLGFLCCAVLMAATAMAQYGSASNTQNNTKMKETKLTGCLSGPNDENAYMLKTKAGRSIEVGGKDDLKGHVGHEVTLTGEWARSGAEIGENEKAEHEHGAEG